MYLILDGNIDGYRPSDKYGDYANGGAVTSVGKALSPLANTAGLFVETNENTNIRAYAALTDSNKWTTYADVDRDGCIAIGGPTAELFVSSYNKVQTDSSKLVNTLSCNTVGYSQSISQGWLTTDFAGGLYNKGSDWWLAAPNENFSNRLWFVFTDLSSWTYHDVSNTHAVHPVVCIPTSSANGITFEGIL